MSPRRLVLASTSPRRRTLLTEHGYEFEVVPPQIEEVMPPHFSPVETVLLNARRKAAAVSRVRPDALVIGVDTLVAIDGRMLGKPRDGKEAFRILTTLNGHAHEVFSGVCFAANGGAWTHAFAEMTCVHFHRRTDAQLRAYLARINPLDKAGAYAAQEDNGEMIATVDGSWTNIVGLPMEALARELRATGA